MTAMKTDYRKLYDKDFIGAWDIDGTDKVITIKRVDAGQLTSVGGRKSKKPVIYFEGSDKGFALNSTNGKTIAAMYGVYVEGWIGKKIALFKSTTRNPDGSGDVDCIRVRPKAPDQGFGDSDDKIAAEQVQELEQLCAAKGVKVEDVLKQARIEKLDDMLLADFGGAKTWIQKKAAAAAKGI